MIRITLDGKNKYSESKRLINKANKEKQLVLFVGAGVSVDSGMPLWNDAIKTIAKRLGMDPSKPLDNLKVPQYYFNSRGEKEYTQLMREVFRSDEKLYPTKIHNAILEFDTNTILTTNYDHLLEQTAENNGKFLQVISQDIDLPYRKSGKELIKIHGDFEHNNFVLKEDDYLHYHMNFKLIENYVKSLIGTKTVLFIGYSLNDPDVKHVFSWVKEILDENFQRAYLIEAGKPYDKNEDEYFKHLGVNLIYSQELLEEPTTTSNNLLRTLMYLLEEDTEEKNLEDILYDYLNNFSSMNYVLEKYIVKAIHNTYTNNDESSIYTEGNALVFMAAEGSSRDALFDKLANAIKSKETDNEDKKIGLIIDTLAKSSITEIRKQIPRVPNKNEKCSIPQTSQPDWVSALNNFDYEKLIRIRDKNAKVLSERNVELYMQQAYICAFLKDYLTAYYCLENAANYYYRKREYAWYFIAVWNKRNIAQIICYESFPCEDIDSDKLKGIKLDFEQINLDKTLQSIPNFGDDGYQFLRDLIGFKVNSELFYDAFKDSVKANKQANEIYSIFAGLPAYESLRERITDYYRYALYNYLIVDRYREDRSIFDLYIRTILISVATPDKELPVNDGFFISRNVHADSLSPNDIHIILRYISSSEINKLFAELNIKQIQISEECEKYLEQLAETIPTVFSSGVQNQNDKFWTFIVLLSHISVPDVVIEKMVKAMCLADDDEYLSNKNNTLIKFFNTIYSHGQYSNMNVCESVKQIIYKLLHLIAKNENARTFYHGSIVGMCAFCREGNIQLSDCDLIDSLLKNKCELLVSELAKYCDKSTEKHVINYFKKRRIGNTYQDYKLYSSLLIEGIIKPDFDVENRALTFIRKSNEEEKEQEDKGIHSYPKNDLLTWYVEIYLKGQIHDSNTLLELIKEFGNDIDEWLTDIDGFDYEKMDIAWLTMVNTTLLEKLAGNTDVREKIIKAFKEQYQRKYVNDNIVRIIVKYFL